MGPVSEWPYILATSYYIMQKSSFPTECILHCLGLQDYCCDRFTFWCSGSLDQRSKIFIWPIYVILQNASLPTGFMFNIEDRSHYSALVVVLLCCAVLLGP